MEGGGSKKCIQNCDKKISYIAVTLMRKIKTNQMISYSNVEQTEKIQENVHWWDFMLTLLCLQDFCEWVRVCLCFTSLILCSSKLIYEDYNGNCYSWRKRRKTVAYFNSFSQHYLERQNKYTYVLWKNLSKTRLSWYSFRMHAKTH